GTVEFRDTPQETAFREEVRAFIDANLPPAFRIREPEWGMFNTARGRTNVPPEEHRAWRKRLSARGWIAPAWPKEYGGAGMTVVEQAIFNEEMAHARAPG